MDFQSQPQQSDLLNEPLSDSEVRTLLERLGSLEFGGAENATIGTVVEATSSDATTVARLLAEVRKGTIEDVLHGHEDRIQVLEQSAKYVAYPRPPTNPLFIPFEYPKTDVDPMSPSEVRRGRYQRSMILFVAIIAFIGFMVFPSCYR